MAKPDLGEKQHCPECEKKFYDLGKNPAICPYCAASFDPSELAAIPRNAPKPETEIKPGDEDDEDIEDGEANIDEEDIDVDEAVAKELELDGDASFGPADVDEDGVVADAPDLVDLPDTGEPAIVLDDDDSDILPPADDENESLEDVLASEEENSGENE